MILISTARWIAFTGIFSPQASSGALNMIMSLVIALSLATSSASATAAHLVGDDPAVIRETVPLPALSPRQANQLRIFEPILLNPSADIDQATRTAAATELLAMNVGQATQVLEEAIQSR